MKRASAGRDGIGPPLPHNLNAERSVLGAILLDNRALNAAIEQLNPEDFFHRHHRRIFQQMIALGEEQSPIDLVSLAEQLHRQGELEAAGGAAYLAQLVDGVPRVTSVGHYARIVKEKALLRSLVNTAHEVEEAASNPGAKPEAVAKKAAQSFRRLQSAAESGMLSKRKFEDGAMLLDEVRRYLRKFVVMTEAQATVVATWAMHTHAFKAAEATPYLSITSAEKESGKTLLLEVLELLVPKPWLTGRVTAAVLIRKIDSEHPTLLLDESDAALGSEKEYAEALRGVLNTGHRRGGRSSCCVRVGGEIEYRDFSTFSPKAIAGIGKLPDTVAGRSVPIRLKRKKQDDPKERTERFHRRDAEADATPLRERLAAWAAANLGCLREARPDLPEGLTDRQDDACEPLLAIADIAGGEWPERLRSALIELLSSKTAADDSLSVRLLRDIRDVFISRGIGRMSSVELVGALNSIEESGWSEFNRGRPLTPTTLARLLSKYDIAPRTIRVGDKTPKGFLAEDFTDPWSRFLTSEPQQPPRLSVFNAFGDISEPPQLVRVAAENPDSDKENQHGGGVAAHEQAQLEDGFLQEEI